MKFGRAVSVCTELRNHFDRTSLRKIAKNSGRIDVAIPRKLIARVFSSTCPICAICVGELTSISNHCSPTNSLPSMPSAGL